MNYNTVLTLLCSQVLFALKSLGYENPMDCPEDSKMPLSFQVAQKHMPCVRFPFSLECFQAIWLPSN